MQIKKEKDSYMPPAFSSGRWCPTPEQRMILKELYSRGITNPNSSQIQRITAHLSLYGKIHGKNVFYWFQNHKARDRQKLKKKQLLRYSFADPLLVQKVAFQTDHHGILMNHAWSSELVLHDHLPCCGNIKPLKTLQLFPLSSVDHQNMITAHSHL